MLRGRPGVLDFQDALYGPITYDLVSLLRDAFIEWEEDFVLDLVIRYWEKARAAGLPVVNRNFDDFYREFEVHGRTAPFESGRAFLRASTTATTKTNTAQIYASRTNLRRMTRRYNELQPFYALIVELVAMMDCKQATVLACKIFNK